MKKVILLLLISSASLLRAANVPVSGLPQTTIAGTNDSLVINVAVNVLSNLTARILVRDFIQSLSLATNGSTNLQNRTFTDGMTRADQGRNPALFVNTFTSYGTHLTEAQIKADIDSMCTNGYRDSGWKYYVIDDGWTYPCAANIDSYFTNSLGHVGRSSTGVLLVDTNRFPSAIGNDSLSNLFAYIHARGLKVGVYFDAGPLCTSGLMTGTGGHEQLDVATVASWGVDLIKFDQGSDDQDYYERLSQYCITTSRTNGRPIYLESGLGGVGRTFPNWIPKVINAWRPVPNPNPNNPAAPENGDMHPSWTNQMAHLDSYTLDSIFIGPGHVPSADVMETGTPDKGWSAMTLMSLFSMYSCALGVKPAQVQPGSPGFERRWFTNSEVIAIDQDPLVAQPWIVSSNNGVQVFAKKLETLAPNGPVAVCFLNRNYAINGLNATIAFTNIWVGTSVATVRDVWARSVINYYTNTFTCPTLWSTNALLYKITPGVQLPFPYGTNMLDDNTVWWQYPATNNGQAVTNGITDLPPQRSLNANGNGLITMNTNVYKRGIAILAQTGLNANLTYFLGGLVSQFHAEVGVDDSAGLGGAISVTNQVFLDGVSVYSNNVNLNVSTAAPQVINIDCTGKTTMQIRATASTGNGQSDWANAYFVVKP